MDRVDVLINRPDEFDRAVHGDDRVRAIPSGEDLAIITKDGATTAGRAGAVLTWTCEVDGVLRRAQYSVQVRILKAALRALDAAYTDDGMPR